MKSQVIIVAVSISLLFTVTNLCNAFQYKVIDLGTLPDCDYSFAYSINNHGKVVGESRHGKQATLFDETGDGNNIYLGQLATGLSYRDSSAYSINNNGQIVGVADAGTAGDWPTLFDPTGGGANINLGSLGSQPGDGDDHGVARSINDNGQIVGWSNTPQTFYGGFKTHATLFDPTGNGNNVDLGTLGGDYSYAYCINDNNKIVGYAVNASGDHRATVFDATGNGNNNDLGTLGGSVSAAYYINDNDQIVGGAEDASGEHFAALFTQSGNVNLGTLGGNSSFAYCINNVGQIVGYAKDSVGQSLATLFNVTENGNNINLNNLINPSSNWKLEIAWGINDNGWIVGYGINPEGYRHGFLLTPEPSTLLLFGLGTLISRKRS